MTFDNVLQFVYSKLTPSDKRPSREVVMDYANNALDMIDVKRSSWYNNESLLGLNSMNIPEDCIEVERVVYNSEELKYRSIFELEQNDADWRTSSYEIEYYTLDETNIILSSLVGSASTSMLYVYGKAKLPHFPNTVGEVNPLVYLPTKFHLMPAYFVLENLPVDPEDKLQVARKLEFAAKWEKALNDISYAGVQRESQPFSY